jgi:hypothetical protein
LGLPPLASITAYMRLGTNWRASRRIHTRSWVASLPIVTDIEYGTLYDGTLRTFALMKIKKIHDVWKDNKKMHKISSI